MTGFKAKHGNQCLGTSTSNIFLLLLKATQNENLKSHSSIQKWLIQKTALCKNTSLQLRTYGITMHFYRGKSAKGIMAFLRMCCHSLNPAGKVNLSYMHIPLVMHGHLTPHPTHLLIYQSSSLILKICMHVKKLLLKAFFVESHSRHSALMQNGPQRVFLLPQLLSIHPAGFHIQRHLIPVTPILLVYNPALMSALTFLCCKIFSSVLVTFQHCGLVKNK